MGLHETHIALRGELEAECNKLRLAFDERCRVIEMQLKDKQRLTEQRDAAQELAGELLAALEAVFRQTVTLRLMPDLICQQMMAAAIAKAQGKE
jgi:hypothetical protein